MNVHQRHLDLLERRVAVRIAVENREGLQSSRISALILPPYVAPNAKPTLLAVSLLGKHLEMSSNNNPVR
jgi:hypothetical protein